MEADHGEAATGAWSRARWFAPAAGQSVEVILVLSAARQVRGTVVDCAGAPGRRRGRLGRRARLDRQRDDRRGGRLHASRPRPTRPPRSSPSPAASAAARAALPAARTRTPSGYARILIARRARSTARCTTPTGTRSAADVVACEGQPAETRAQSGADGTFQLAPSAIGCDAVAEHSELRLRAIPSPVVEGKPLVAAPEGRRIDRRGGRRRARLGRLAGHDRDRVLRAGARRGAAGLRRAPLRTICAARFAGRSWRRGATCSPRRRPDAPPCAPSPIDVRGGSGQRRSDASSCPRAARSLDMCTDRTARSPGRTSASTR